MFEIYGKVDKEKICKLIISRGLFKNAPYISKVKDLDTKIEWVAYHKNRDVLLLCIRHSVRYVRIKNFKRHHPYFFDILKYLNYGYILKIMKRRREGIFIYFDTG